MLKRSMILAGVMTVVAGGAAQAQSTKPVPVFVNGGRLNQEAVMLTQVGRTILPMRSLFESLGARVEWDARQRAVYAWTPDGNGVRLGLGERNAQRMRMSADPSPGNWGKVVSTDALDAPAQMVGGRVFIPVRFASEALNADVRFTSNRPAVYIQTEAVAGYREEEPLPSRPVDPDPLPVEPREETGPITSAMEIGRAVTVNLELDGERFSRQDRVPMRLTVRNNSNRTVVLPFSSGQMFDIEVLQEDRLVWNWAANRSFTQALTDLTLQPGEEKTFTANWRVASTDGRIPAPGRYRVRGIVMTSFREPQLLDEETITLRR